jgi:hypothetical protein
MNKITWIVRSGFTATECASFPYAFRTAFNIVRKALEKNQNVNSAINGIQIVGPPNGKGETMKYTYSSAVNLAKSMGLLLPDGTINQKEFKRR